MSAVCLCKGKNWLLPLTSFNLTWKHWLEVVETLRRPCEGTVIGLHGKWASCDGVRLMSAWPWFVRGFIPPQAENWSLSPPLPANHFSEDFTAAARFIIKDRVWSWELLKLLKLGAFSVITYNKQRGMAGLLETEIILLVLNSKTSQNQMSSHQFPHFLPGNFSASGTLFPWILITFTHPRLHFLQFMIKMFLFI